MPPFALLVRDRWEADFIGSFLLARCLGSGPTTLLTTRIGKGFLASLFGRFLGRVVFAHSFFGFLSVWPKANGSFPGAGGSFLLSFFKQRSTAGLGFFVFLGDLAFVSAFGSRGLIDVTVAGHRFIVMARSRSLG